MIISMKRSLVLSAITHRVLRNGKIVISKKKNTIKKKSVPKEKINNKLSFLKTISKYISNLKVRPSMFNDHKNKKNITNHTKLEDYILLNELQIITELESKMEKCDMLSATKETKQTHYTTSNSFKNKSVLKAETSDHLVVNQTSDERITRGKKIKLQMEERKQLDQKIIDKFPTNTFKMFDIQLYDIKEQIQFCRKLGLIYTTKCAFTCKLKKKSLYT